MEALTVISERAAAKRVGLSAATLRKWRRAKVGQGPAFVRLGEKRIGYRIADLDAWVSARVEGLSVGSDHNEVAG